MSRKTISRVLMIGGALVLLLSLAADSIGIGSYPGFHGAQIAGAAAGLVVLVIGFFLGRAAEKK